MNASLATTLLVAAAFGSVVAASSAQAASPTQQPTPNANLTILSPWFRPTPPAPPPGPKPLFQIGNLAVGIWAPVEPYYNTNADRNLAADPLWFNPNGA